MDNAPSGKSRTTVTPMTIPCALSYDCTGETTLLEEELELELEPALAPELELVAADVVEVKGFSSVVN